MAASPVKKAQKGKVTPAKKAPPTRTATKAKTGAGSKAAPARTTAKSSKSAPKPAGKAPAKQAAKAPARTAKKATAPKPAAKSSVRQATKSAAAPARRAPSKVAPKPPAKAAAKPEPVKQSSKSTAKATAKPTVKPTPTAPAPSPIDGIPKPKFNKEGLGYTKDFDLPFVKAQYDLLQRERIHLTGQAKRLEAEAHQLVEEAEMGDVQFDDEGGEGDTMVVERERDLALSAQARDAVAEIDAALARITDGTYGYSVLSGRPIPKERLEAIPWSSVLVEEKVGGIGRR